MVDGQKMAYYMYTESIYLYTYMYIYIYISKKGEYMLILANVQGDFSCLDLFGGFEGDSQLHRENLLY